VNQLLLIFRKEWLNFRQSDRSVFIVYLFLIAGWGMLIATAQGQSVTSAALWLVFFSVIIAANFSSTVFVSERMTGSLEILLTCGLSRGAILYGKVAFVLAMTLAIGMLCALVGGLLRPFIGAGHGSALPGGAVVSSAVLYVAAALFNAASSACFSVWLPNPRLLHFINLLILAAVMSAYMALSEAFSLPLYTVSILLFATGAVFLALGRRAFESERIAKPVIF
jgi:ABC-type Na+ efflux pump permease subunit